MGRYYHMSKAVSPEEKEEILREINKREARPAPPRQKAPEEQDQLSMAELRRSDLIDRLKKLDVQTLTPLETMKILYDLTQSAKEL